MVEFIDAKGLVAGRLASHIAQRALTKKEVMVVNCGKAVMTGSEDEIMDRFRKKREKGDAFHGPFYPSKPSDVFRRMVRGMLPYKKDRGKDALERVKVFKGIPKKYKDEDFDSIEEAEMSDSETKYLELSKISEGIKNVK